MIFQLSYPMHTYLKYYDTSFFSVPFIILYISASCESGSAFRSQRAGSNFSFSGGSPCRTAPTNLNHPLTSDPVRALRLLVLVHLQLLLCVIMESFVCECVCEREKGGNLLLLQKAHSSSTQLLSLSAISWIQIVV